MEVIETIAVNDAPAARRQLPVASAVIAGALALLAVGALIGLSEPSLSPDGRLIAFVSDESGTGEVYVRAIDPASGVTTTTGVKVSTGGGEEPAWSADGRELFYRAGSRMMAATIAAGDALRSSRPAALATPRRRAH